MHINYQVNIPLFIYQGPHALGRPQFPKATLVFPLAWHLGHLQDLDKIWGMPGTPENKNELHKAMISEWKLVPAENVASIGVLTASIAVLNVVRVSDMIYLSMLV